jgi:hypothetical protein
VVFGPNRRRVGVSLIVDHELSGSEADVTSIGHKAPRYLDPFDRCPVAAAEITYPQTVVDRLKLCVETRHGGFLDDNSCPWSGTHEGAFLDL